MVAAVNTIRSMARPEASQMRFMVSTSSLKSTMLFIHNHKPDFFFVKHYSPILAEAAKIFVASSFSGYVGYLGKKYYAVGFHKDAYGSGTEFKADPLTWLHGLIVPTIETGVATGIAYSDSKFPYSAVS